MPLTQNTIARMRAWCARQPEGHIDVRNDDVGDDEPYSDEAIVEAVERYFPKGVRGFLESQAWFDGTINGSRRNGSQIMIFVEMVSGEAVGATWSVGVLVGLVRGKPQIQGHWLQPALHVGDRVPEEALRGDEEAKADTEVYQQAVRVAKQLVAKAIRDGEIKPSDFERSR